MPFLHERGDYKIRARCVIDDIHSLWLNDKGSKCVLYIGLNSPILNR